MKVVLTDKVKSLGSVGEIVNVSEGYARNFLIPQKKAKLADEGNEKQMADYQKMLAKKVSEEKAGAEALGAEIKKTSVSLIKKVGGNGKLFGSVTNADISKGLEAQGVMVERRMISIPVAIKTLGTFNVEAKLFSGVEVTFPVTVEIDPKQAEEMKKKQEAAAKRKAEKKNEVKAEETEGAEADAETLEATEQE